MTEEKNPWEGYDPKAPLKEKPSPEELVLIVERLNKLEQTRLEPPKWIRVLQSLAIIYIGVNIWILCAIITHPMAGIYIAYVLPLTMLLLFFIYIAGQFKKIARDEKT